mmetsp:Transcript_31113/g.73960  ORF Transcript_31113/g.73960 Transcript_31113/m.73960 type:complete len:298 (+) Transcript_31113:318-1211(+)
MPMAHLGGGTHGRRRWSLSWPTSFTSSARETMTLPKEQSRGSPTPPGTHLLRSPPAALLRCGTAWTSDLCTSCPSQYSPIWPGSAQYAWLLEDLAQVNRTVTPWLVAVWHTPWYSSNENHKLEAEPMRRRLERLMYDAGVNVVINGHVHAYERTHPVFEFERDECAPTYLVVGDAGNYEGPATPWADPKPVWSAFRQASFGTGVLEFQGSEKAVWTWRRRACVRLHGGMFDVWTHLNNATYFVPFTTKDGICETEDDNSQTSSLRLDSTVIHQHPNRCKRSRNSFVSRTNPSNLQTF